MAQGWTSPQVLKTHTRAAARHVALEALSAQWRLQGKIDKRLAEPRISLPYFHAVPREREGAFRELLNRLSRTHTFISYGEAMERVAKGPIDKPYMAFSFDDGFKSNVRTARILEEFGTTGCFFVPVDFIGTSTVGEAREFFGFSDGVDEPAMTWDDLEGLKSRGHMVENHTLNHNVLSWIPESQYIDEIGLAAEVLRSRLGQAKHFAWPRGRFFHVTKRAAEIVFETGHETCASAERGAHVATVNGPREALCIRRDHLMAEWPVRHCLYFLAASAAGAQSGCNEWPKDLAPRSASKER